ncbi:hypothetical protein NDU88_000929 [Pleurodeles waltl]|uniref:Natural cytotoxicity triggering receptor 3 n=1 Tax=Pleurodeles waltl TaxID=8319 RepID=A0AAV7Q747_PLEWA|nr:hypothetical protein NDU88_000929 [Pleurodeles waltl]
MHVLSCLLLSAGARAPEQSVQQHPQTLEVQEGEAAVMDCTFHSSDGQVLAVVKFFKWPELFTVTEDSPIFAGRINKTDMGQDKAANTRTVSLHIRALTICDSGHYYCEVQFFGGQALNGTGTSLQVNRIQGQLELGYLHTALQIIRIILLLVLISLAAFLIAKFK